MSVFEKVKEIIVKNLNVKPEEVAEDKHFINDFGADSLDTVELIMALEKEFGITSPDEDATKITTVGEVVKYIESHKK